MPYLICQFSRHIVGPTVYNFFHVFQCFSSYSRSYSVHFSFFTLFSVPCHIPVYTVFVSNFPPFSIFSPYSMSYSLHFYFFTLFTVSIFKVCVSHFPRFSFSFEKIYVLLWVFLIFHFFSSQSTSYSVCFSFCTFFSVSRHIYVLSCEFLIFLIFQSFIPHFISYHVSFYFSSFFSFLAIFQVCSYSVQFSFFLFFSVSRHIPGPTVGISHFSRYSVFLTTFQVIQCLCLIFHFFQFSHHIPCPTVCISTFSCFSLFLSIFQVLQCVSLIFHVFQLFRQNPGPICIFHIFHVFHCFSSKCRSYSVCFSFCTFFRVSYHILCPTMWVSHFPHLSVFSPYSRSYIMQFLFYPFTVFLYIFLILHVLHCFSAFPRETRWNWSFRRRSSLGYRRLYRWHPEDVW
jgi:hypothetical protein